MMIFALFVVFILNPIPICSLSVPLVSAVCTIFVVGVVLTTVYHISHSRNDAVWNGFVRSPFCISVLVRDDVSHRFHSLHLMIVDDSTYGWLS